MPYRRLIPCLDVSGGRVVKCVRFENPRDMGDPVELARAYGAGGADELVFLDIDATVKDRGTMLEVVRRVAQAVNIPFAVGGGLRTEADGARFIEAGADRVSLNSAAIANPRLITALARRYGSQAVVVAIDTRGGAVYSRAGTVAANLDTVQWARQAVDCGAGEILLTSIDADGTREGYDLEITRQVAAAVNVPVIASGGAGNASHVADVFQVAQAAIVASIVHENPQGITGLRKEIMAAGIPLRENVVDLLNV